MARRRSREPHVHRLLRDARALTSTLRVPRGLQPPRLDLCRLCFVVPRVRINSHPGRLLTIVTLELALVIAVLWLLASFPIAVLVGRAAALNNVEAAPSPAEAENGAGRG